MSTFRFLLDKADLLLKWQQFVNRSNRSVTKNSVICLKHFEDKFLLRTKLNWKLSPIPSIHTHEAQKDHQLCASHRLCVSLLKSELFKKMNEHYSILFNKKDRIDSVDDLSEHHSPPGYA